MTSAGELLAMLTARGIDLMKIPGGGIPDLTSLDVAAAMSHLSPMASSMLFAKYAFDSNAYRHARVYWFDVIMSEKALRGWTSDAPGRFKALADATLGDHMGDHICRICNGVGSVMAGPKKIDCHGCEGSGHKQPSDRSMARAIGVGKRDYDNQWKARVTWARMELARIEGDALYKIAKHLG